MLVIYFLDLSSRCINTGVASPPFYTGRTSIVENKVWYVVDRIQPVTYVSLGIYGDGRRQLYKKNSNNNSDSWEVDRSASRSIVMQVGKVFLCPGT